MGQVSHKKIIILICCFLLATIVVNRQAPTEAVPKKMPLKKALSNIKGWQVHSSVPLSQKIVASLDLDDYVNQNYYNGQDIISLYIGFYLTKKKVGAAHSPLVCFPGQGWIITDIEKKTLKIEENLLHYASIILTKGQERQLALYWFQAVEKTSPDTFRQKINLFWNRIKQFGNDINGNNAFVRVIIPLHDKSISKAQSVGENFIEFFYPDFLKYVKEV